MTTYAERLFGVDAECVCCHQSGHATVDHTLPRVLGGTSDPNNLRPRCFWCNKTKSEYEWWLREEMRFHGMKLTTARRLILRNANRDCAERQHRPSYYVGRCHCGNCMTAPILFGASTR